MLDKNNSSMIAAAATHFNKEKEYWLEKLKGNLVKSYFTYDFNESSKIQESMEMIHSRFPEKLFEKFRWISNNSDSKLHMLLVTGVVALLSKYTGNKDIIVGSPIYKQKTEGTFINTVLILRNQLADEMTFKDLLMEVKQTITEAVKNENYPLKALLYELNIPYSEVHFPLFDIVVILKNNQDKKYIQHIQNNITFSFFNNADTIEASIEYNKFLYEEKTVRRIMCHLIQMLECALFNLDLPFKDLYLLSAAEKEELLYHFNNTEKEYPVGLTINQLFEEQVEKTPDKTAVIFGDAKITYGQLNYNADCLAHTLKKKGIASDKIVGILLGQSVELCIAIMAVLKSGGAYLPIDPQYPSQRIHYFLKDSQASLVLVEIQEREMCESHHWNWPIEWMTIREHIWQDNPVSLELTCNASSLAYVIYTSGSTGRPKGAMLEHRSVVNTLLSRKEEYKMDTTAIALQLFSHAFDGFITSFFTPLISGAEVVFIGAEKVDDIFRITDVIAREKVTHMICVPALYQAIIENITEDEISNLRIVTLAGDKVLPIILIKTQQKNVNIEIVNEYGITEAAVMSTLFRNQEKNEEIKIGSPIKNTKIYICDQHLQLNPVGVYGELCVGGTGVSRGYMNKPEITHEKFTMAPFDPGKRIYLTGDLARWLPDGTIQFLGRTDYQVKIRGYRIEPGEIENRLLKHEKIKEAFVIPRTENSNNYLCAYIISCESLKTEDLRNYLLSYLPEYMIPSYFVTLEKFPITPNGKIDREALPAPDINAAHEYVAPTDNLEKKLVAIWADILMLDQEIIGIDTSFFELGGHSLKTTLLVSRIHKEFRVKLPMTEVFRNPKIRYMAEYIRNSTMDIYTTIEPIEKKTYYPLSSAQKRLYILQQMNVESVAYNIRDLVMLEEKPKLEKLEEAFRQLIQRHESLRTSFEMINGETYQRIHADVRLAVQYFDLTMLESGLLETSEEKMIQDFEKSFDLSQAPLIRVGLIKSDNFRYILVVDMHHIISDGISREILIEDFKALYADKKLPELKLHYKDYSEWQNSSLMRENLAKQENYWLSLFNPPLPRLNLPTDYPRTKIMSFEGNFAHFMTEKEETAQLNKIVRSENATMFIVILAIYNIFLAKISNQEDIIVGVPIAGRNHADLEKVIGMFVNTLALRNQPTGQRTFLEFLREVKKNTLQAFDNQDYLFEQLVEKVDDRCDLNRNPIFDVIFSFYSEENANRKTTPTTESIDLKIKPYPLKSTSSKFDLSLSASENGEILHFTFSYKLKLFKKEKIELFSQYFRRILSQISKNPNIEIRSIEIIDKSQKDNLMADVYDDLENE